MIERTICPHVIRNISLRPVTSIIGACQVGKTTLCLKLRDRIGMNYVSLRDGREREMARSDPESFLEIHKAPLIIDGVQYAPSLLEYIEAVADRVKEEGDPMKDCSFSQVVRHISRWRE